jgi:hypothetical protein
VGAARAAFEVELIVVLSAELSAIA